MAGALAMLSHLWRAAPSIPKVQDVTKYLNRVQSILNLAGRIGASNQPWQGTWRANVTVELATCHLPREDKRSIRYKSSI